MNKNKKTHAVIDKIDGIKREINDMAELCKTENRERNDKEEARYKELRRELSYWEMKLAATGAEQQREESPWQQFRERIEGERRFSVVLREGGAATSPTAPASTAMSTADLADNPIVPLTVGDIIEPLEEGTIIGKLGMRMPTGLRGKYESTVVGTIEVSVEDEGAETEEQKIDLDSVAADNQRLSAVVRASRQSLFQSDYKLENIIKNQLTKGLARGINQIMLGVDLFNAKTRIKGPFVDLKAKATALAAFGAGTFKALNKIKAGILGKGFTSEYMCWVMSEGTKAELEATPKDAGSGIMVIENDRMCGLPVYCSHFITDDYIGLGDWGFQLCGLFDRVSMVVDPFTKAGSDQVRFILNANYGTLTYRPEAFALAKVTR